MHVHLILFFYTHPWLTTLFFSSLLIFLLFIYLFIILLTIQYMKGILQYTGNILI